MEFWDVMMAAGPEVKDDNTEKEIARLLNEG
jgi:hypothetical protein